MGGALLGASLHLTAQSTYFGIAFVRIARVRITTGDVAPGPMMIAIMTL